MKFITGLGNPGEKYIHTRHNVGFLVVEAIASALQAPDFTLNKKFIAEVSKVGDILLIKPQTFMNESGKALSAAINFYEKSIDEEMLKQVYVIHDDLDIQLGEYKIQWAKGPKIHNGLTSVYQYLHTTDFWHVRIGVDNRHGDRRVPGHEYVLSQFHDEEKNIISQVVEQVSQQVIASL